MGLLNLSNQTELCSKLLEAFLFRYLSEVLVHLCPLVVLSVRCRLQVLLGVSNTAAKSCKLSEPHLSVVLFIRGSVIKELGNLLISVFSCLGCIVVVLISCLCFARKRFPQILLCLCSLVIRHNLSSFTLLNHQLPPHNKCTVPRSSYINSLLALLKIEMEEAHFLHFYVSNENTFKHGTIHKCA